MFNLVVQDFWEDDVVIGLHVQRCDHIESILNEQGVLTIHLLVESIVQLIVDDHVAIVLSKKYLNIFHVDLKLQRSIWSDFSFEDWQELLHA